MKKIFLIGWKDLRLAFRDRAALILMLAAPFVLTLGLGFVTGSFSPSNTGLSQIPVTIVNLDQAELGDTLAAVFSSEELADLVAAIEMDDPAAARKGVDDDQSTAAVIIPAGFSQSIIPAPGSSLNDLAVGEVRQIEVYANPTRPVSAGVVQTIVETFLNHVEIGRVSGQVIVTQMVTTGLIGQDRAESAGREIGMRQAEAADAESTIRLKKTQAGEAPVSFNPLAFMAPGMALMFLMFTVTNGGRSLLAERSQGTLPRLLVSPTRSSEVMAGKVVGIFLTGLAQLGILIGGSTLLFGLEWGDALGVLVLVAAAVFGATGWGLLLTALSRTPGQVSSIGSALMLIFGILGGSFINLAAMPPAIQLLSKITPNAWGLMGFTTLGLGGSLADLGEPVMALVIMGAVLFGAAVVLFNRQGTLSK
jgi:ABC-2 type transport system permease protein